jgi:DNA-binding HxlR family transcriptional regulator
MQSTTEISQKGLNDMKELNIMEATVLTSPNPLTLKGQDLLPVFYAIMQWGIKYIS